MALSSLDAWLAGRMGRTRAAGAPTATELHDWQLNQLRSLINHARDSSPFYARHLADVEAAAIRSLPDIAALPFLTPAVIRGTPEQLLCVSQDDIARAVTLYSSGSTGDPKRVFHTADDLESTVDYFTHGMSNLVAAGQTALVLMPADRPGGVGRLLVEALDRTGARAVPHGALENAGKGVDHLLQTGAACIVGPACHVNMLAREWERQGLSKTQVQSVLLCWDATPDAVVRNAEQAFGCNVFRHWGMIETGLGGAVECSPGAGMHLREADILLEIIEPETGIPVPDGEFGEMVVTTLTRRGMPLIRYRTGDKGRLLPGTCHCNSPLRRLDPAIRRIKGGVPLSNATLTISALNEALYALPEVSDFAAEVVGNTLRLTIATTDQRAKHVIASVTTALKQVPELARELRQERVVLDVRLRMDGTPAVAGLGKRSIRN